MKKIIATQPIITQDQAKHFFKEAKEVHTYLLTLNRLFKNLLKTISTPTAFLKTLDSLIRHTHAKPTVSPKNTEALELLPSVLDPIEKFAYVFLEDSLAMHSRSLKEFPLWKLFLAVKIKLEGIQISQQSIRAYLGSSDTDLPVSTTASDASTQLRASIQAKKKSSPSTDYDRANNQTWDSCLATLSQLDLIHSQIPPKHQETCDQLLQAIHASINGNPPLCSVGALGQLQELSTIVIGHLPDASFEFLAAISTHLFIHRHIQIALQKMRLSSLDGPGFNVHEAKAVVRTLATARGMTDIPVDPYTSTHLDIIQATSAENAKYFSDPLLILELISDLNLLPNAPEVVTLANNPTLLDREDSKALILLRSKIADWAVSNMATSGIQLEKLMTLLNTLQPAGEGIEMMPTHVLLLRSSALYGCEDVFCQLMAMKGVSVDFNAPIPGDPDGRTYFHLALIGGNRAILDVIYDKLTPETKAILTASPHKLLHHSATSKNDTAIRFLFEKGLVTVANIDEVDGEGWTALQRAAFCGNSSGLQFLMEKYLENSISSDFQQQTGIFSRTPNRQTLLHLAIHSGDTESVRAVLESSAFRSLSLDLKKQFFNLKTSGDLSAIDMSLMSQNMALYPLLLLGLCHEGKLDLSKVDLRSLTLDHVKTLPDDLQIQRFCLSSPEISPDVLMALLAKLQPWNVALTISNLETLTVEHVETLPDTLQIDELNLTILKIHPAVLMALLAKLKPWNVALAIANLETLTVEHVETLPDTLQIHELSLRTNKILPNVLMALLSKLKPKSNVNLYLDRLTVDMALDLPDGLKIQDLHLRGAKIPPNVLMELLSTLNPKKSVSLFRVNLSTLTLEQVATLHDTLQVESLDLRETGILPDVSKALCAKCAKLQTKLSMMR